MQPQLAGEAAARIANARTLVLNADYRPLSYFPLSTLPWEDAVHAVFLGRYNVVAEYEDLVARSPSMEIKIPSVVALREFKPVKRRPAFNRYNLFLRDRHRCQYCGTHHATRDLTFDHVIPRSKGGTNGWQNVVAACVPCNGRKGNKLLSECGMKLIRRPIEPAWSDLYEAGRSVPSDNVHAAWNDFLYWTVELDQS